MNLLIWGAGAIGGTMGACLAQAGHEVVLVDRAADHVAVINRAGLGITGPIAEFRVQVPACTPEQVQGQFERIILATKAQDTADATLALLPHLDAGGCVVSAQNGLNELTIARLAGARRTIGAFVNFGADYLEPGLIHYAGRGAVVVGELDGRITPRLVELRDVLAGFDPAAAVTDNIWGFLWGKEAYGALLFATALTNESIADALAQQADRALYVDLAREVLAVALTQGVSPKAFDGFDPAAFAPGAPREAAAGCLDELVAFNRRSAKTHSGIWRDLAVRKRRTEVDAQLGVVAALGKEAGVPTPLLDRLIQLIHDIEDGRRTQGRDTLDSLRSLRSLPVR